MNQTRLVALAALALGACVYDLDFHTQGGTGGAPVCKPGATATCYDGPAGTEGVGICKAGAKTCAADGTSWGPCAGEVLPQPVDCASGVDKHCDGKVLACQGKFGWAERFDGSNASFGFGVASDAMDNVLVTGCFYGAIGFGGSCSMFTGKGGSDIFITKLDPSGACMWSKSYGDIGDQFGLGVAADGAGNVLATGKFTGTVDFGGGPLTAASFEDVYALKLDAAGNHQWSRRFGGAAGQVGAGVAPGAAGSTFLVGTFYGMIDFGGINDGLTGNGEGDIFIAKLDANGNHVWSKSFGDAGNQQALGVATDAAGHVVVTGAFQGTVDFGGGPLTSAGGHDLFVVELDSDGNHRWSKRFGGAGDQAGYSVAMTPAGDVVVTGALAGSMDLGGTLGTLTSAGGVDVFALALDPGGNPVWGARFGDASDQIGYGVAIDAARSTIITGAFHGLIDFGGGPLTSAGIDDIFIAKLDSTGNWLWSRRAGGPGSDGGRATVTDSGGNVLVTGNFAQTADFGGGPLMSTGGGFVAKYGP